ncbi:streptogrisin D [Catenuloplanes nepalensis]|uniref:Streptogrisin D n=1 Tax=Catenuloplanes nepalensis TaxID=587533 RepID=A0ABT9MUJ3_9ACTN|nr:S1 family peptidase [Catenuloplanes nepalensis]MDP9795117.1 streptogrisin D [Catenuloplanes nepalensis]
MRRVAVVLVMVVSLLAVPAAAQARALETLPGTAWWTDPATGERHVAADASVGERDLRRLAASAGTVVREPGVRRQFLAGGDPIFPGGSSRCTIGFNVRSTSTPYRYYFITSGHCVGPVGTTVSSGGTVIGTVERRLDPRDLALVRYTPPSGTVQPPHPSAVNRYNGTLQPITTFATAFVGQGVQRADSTTGLRSGTVTALNATVNYAEGTVYGLTRTTVCAEPGDSGGPFFSTTTGLGTFSGGSGNCTSGGVTYFAPVLPYLSGWGVGAY